MSQPNPKVELAEWMNTTMEISLTIHDQTITNRFKIDDGNIPDNMQEQLEIMVANLLDLNEL